MTIHALLDVDVADEKFKQFAKVFDQYQEALKQTPLAWKQTNQAIDEAASAMDDVHDAWGGVEEAVKTTGTTFTQNVLILSQQTKELSEQDKIIRERERLEKAAAAEKRRQQREQEASWKKMTEDAKSFASHVKDATTSLLRWGELTGVISGILGGGGLFGIDRLATSAGNERRTATGLGLTTGQERALGINLQRYVDPSSLEQGVLSTLSDPTKQLPLINLGLNPQAEGQKGTAQATLDVMTALKKKVDATPDNMLGQLISTFQYGNLGLSLQDLKRIKSESPDVYAGNLSRAGSDAALLGYDDKTAKAWQDLQVQLRRAGSELEKDFVVGLVKAAPAIEHLSSAVIGAVDEFTKNGGFTYIVDEVSSGLEDFAAFLKTDEFKADVRTFVADVGALAHAIKKGLELLGVVPSDGGSSSPAGDAADMASSIGSGAALGFVLGGPLGAAAGAAGGWAAQKLFPWHMFGNAPGNAPASKIGSPQAMANEVSLHDMLIKDGLGEDAVSGILGNLQQESGFNPMADNGSHFGIAQWDASRQAKFKAMFGHDIRQSTLAEQEKFIIAELHGDYGQTLADLKASKGARQAATAFNQGYEVSGDTSGVREANAQQASAKFATQTPSVPAHNQTPVQTGNINVYNSTGGNAGISIDQSAGY